MKYPRILAALSSAHWAVTPETLQAIRDTLSARLAGKFRAMDEDMDHENEMPHEPYEMLAPGVAAVQLHGIMGRNLSAMEMECGGCDIMQVEDDLSAALASDQVASVILTISSPGGVVSGVDELCKKIGEMSSETGKPVYAYIEDMGCSAAYWVACGCAGIACSPSAIVGSIGIYRALVDESENWAKEGYKLVLIKSGEFKAAGIAGSKITEEQSALWKSDVDYVYAQFAGAVKMSRPAMDEKMMQGQTFYGQRALEAGLVDKVLPDIQSMADEVSPFMHRDMPG